MAVRITCPGCGSSIAVQPADQGRMIRCAVCRTFVSVPVIERADVPPPPPASTTAAAPVARVTAAPPAKKKSIWPIVMVVGIVLLGVGAIAFVVHRGTGSAEREAASGGDASEREIHDK